MAKRQPTLEEARQFVLAIASLPYRTVRMKEQLLIVFPLRSFLLDPNGVLLEVVETM